MNGGGVRPWPAVGRLRRFGPTVAVLAALVAAGTVATVNDHQVTPRAPAASAATGGGGVPLTYAEAKARGTASRVRWQPGCDPTTGTVAIPDPYAPPCVPAFTGHNGGATGPGVGAHSITVVYYQAPPGDLTAALQGETDTPAQVAATVSQLTALFNAVFATYGRTVKVQVFQGTGTSDDAVAGRADAITVAQQLHAFASIGGPGQTSAYEDELAEEHVLCVLCGLSVPYSSFQADAPYLWSGLPAPDTLLTEAFDFIIGELAGHDAVYAGDPAYHHRRRVFGLVHYDQDPPVFGGLTTELDREFAAHPLRLADQESYLLDLTTLPQEAATIVAHLKAKGVTTVIFAGDPIMPIYLTKAATADHYYPEWVVTGTVYTDTSTLARLYDPTQWAHAFGITDLAVPTPQDQTPVFRLFRWYYGTTPPAPKSASIILSGLQELFTGIQMAGPHLTADSFRAGLFALPPEGGGPTTPLLAFGPHGAPPRPSYSIPDDYAVLWYDATAVGPDEEGAVGTGLYRYVDGGRRFHADQLLTVPLHLFDPAGTVTSYAHPPDQSLALPAPWPGSPAAR